MRAYGVKSLAIFCINSLLLWFVQSYGSDFFLPIFWNCWSIARNSMILSKGANDRRWKMCKEIHKRKRLLLTIYSMWKVVVPRALTLIQCTHTHFHRAHTNTHLNLPPIRNRIQIETRKKIQLENFVWGKLSRVMLSNDTRLYTYPYSAHNTRARSHHGHNAIS